jgi:ankyrin repeat protein
VQAMALLLACTEGRLDAVRELVEGGASIHEVNEGGDSALSIATRNGRVAVVKYLVRIGADVNVANSAGWTPLVLAAYNGHLDVVSELLEQGLKGGLLSGTSGGCSTAGTSFSIGRSGRRHW